MNFDEWMKQVSEAVGEEDMVYAQKLLTSDEFREMYAMGYSIPSVRQVIFAAIEDYEDYDGQPDWAKEWEDFGEVYDDSYPLYDGGED